MYSKIKVLNKMIDLIKVGFISEKKNQLDRKISLATARDNKKISISTIVANK